MPKFYITHTDNRGERHPLEGAWDAETADDAIRQMLDESGADDDGRWEAFKVEDGLYTVARSDGENREFNLTLADAAHRVLTNDGCDYELRPRADGEGFDLWSRQQVAGVGWRRTHWFSLEPDPAVAEADIFARVIEDSGSGDWRGLVAEEQDDYARCEAFSALETQYGGTP